METKREEVANRWNQCVWENGTGAIQGELYGGNSEAMYADLEGYLGERNTVIFKQCYDELEYEVSRSFSFPKKEDRAEVIMKLIRNASAFGLQPDGMDILMENDEVAADVFELSDAEKAIVINEPVRLSEIRMISFSNKSITYVLDGQEPAVLNYADYADGNFSDLGQRLGRIFTSFLKSDQDTISLVDEIGEWEENCEDEEEWLEGLNTELGLK